MNNEKTIGEFIRDVCSVVPRPKSEVRRRLNEIISSTRNQAQIELLETLEFLQTKPTKLLFHSAQYRAIYERIAEEVKEAAKTQIKKLK